MLADPERKLALWEETMSHRSIVGSCLVALTLASVSAGTAGTAGAQAKAGVGVSRRGDTAVLMATQGGAATVVGTTGTPDITIAAATFQVTYTGFSAAARTAFQRAVNLWAPLINSPVPITIAASFEPLGAGVLGSAGPNFLWRDFTGAPRASTWYADAIANKRFGSQLDPSPDIVARFSSSFPNWHFGAAAAPAGKYDFTSVVMHEIGHGLGFLGAGRVSGGLGSVRANFQGQPKLPIIYDRFTETGAGVLLLTGFPDNSTTLAAKLQSNNLFFDSTRVRNANNNQAAKIYAPATFQPGSSYSHLDETKYPAGNANSLMTPALGQAETIRSPGAITRAIFLDLGW